MRKQANKSQLKIYNQPMPTKDPTDMKRDETPEKDYKKLIIKIFNELNEDLRNELREETQEMKGPFNKEIQIFNETNQNSWK